MSLELKTATKPIPHRRLKRAKPMTSVIFATVSSSERLLPRIQRITLQSPDFDGFICDVPDQFITFLFPKGDRRQPAVPRSFNWDDYYKMEDVVRPHARNYTVRAYRPALHEVVVDMILHDDHGIGTSWARSTEPGDQLAIWGPRVAYDPPPNADWYLLMGDEVALPGIAAILEHLPADVSVHVILETDREFDHYPLTTAAQREVVRVDRAGNRGDALIHAVRTISFPDAVVYAWGGGDIRTMQTLGRFLRRERGMRAGDVSTIGYW